MTQSPVYFQYQSQCENDRCLMIAASQFVELFLSVRCCREGRKGQLRTVRLWFSRKNQFHTDFLLISLPIFEFLAIRILIDTV